MLCTIVLVVVSLVFFYARSTQHKRRGLKLPPELPNSLPFIGITHLFIGKDTKGLLQVVINDIGKHIINAGGICHTNAGPYHCYAITDPEDTITVLNQCLEKNWIYEIGQPLTGDGLATVTMNVRLWKHHRKIISRAFNLQVLNGYMDIYNKQSKWLVTQMADNVGKRSFEHCDFLEDMLMQIMYQTMMGLSEEETLAIFDHNHAIAIKSILNLFARRLTSYWMCVQFLYNFTTLKKEEDKLLAYLHEKSKTVINMKRQLLQSTERKSTKFKSFLDLILELPPEEAFSDQEIREEVDTMIIGGTDTSSTTLTFALMLLGAHQDVQDKVCEELFEVFGDSFRDVEKDDLPKLVLMEAVLMETMRLYPILPVIPRYVNEEVKLRNYTVPAGNNCFIFVYSMHRDPRLWGPDADKFNPQRWLPNPPPAAKAFLGFSLGKRGCIGKVFGMMAMKTTLAHLLRHYRLTADITKLELQLDLLLKPASGCEIAIEGRK